MSKGRSLGRSYGEARHRERWWVCVASASAAKSQRVGVQNSRVAGVEPGIHAYLVHATKVRIMIMQCRFMLPHANCKVMLCQVIFCCHSVTLSHTSEKIRPRIYWGPNGTHRANKGNYRLVGADAALRRWKSATRLGTSSLRDHSGTQRFSLAS